MTLLYKWTADPRAVLNCKHLYYVTFFHKFCSQLQPNLNNYKMFITTTFIEYHGQPTSHICSQKKHISAFVLYTERIFNLCLSTAAVVGALSHTKPASAGSLCLYFPCSSTDLIQQKGLSADLQLLSRPHTC